MSRVDLQGLKSGFVEIAQQKVDEMPSCLGAIIDGTGY